MPCWTTCCTAVHTPVSGIYLHVFPIKNHPKHALILSNHPKSVGTLREIIVIYLFFFAGEHQFELLDMVAAKFHEEPGVFKLLVLLRLFCLST